jgi:hypothetical protein
LKERVFLASIEYSIEILAFDNGWVDEDKFSNTEAGELLYDNTAGAGAADENG